MHHREASGRSSAGPGDGLRSPGSSPGVFSRITKVFLPVLEIGRSGDKKYNIRGFVLSSPTLSESGLMQGDHDGERMSLLSISLSF